MKILLINYRFFISGGPERYLFNLKELLERKNHKTIVFSIKYANNEKSKYEKYFVSPLSNEKEIYFKDQTWNLTSLLKTISRSFYSFEVYKNLKNLIIDTKPDFAIVLHYKRKLSPAILTALHDNKVPFVVRLSDFEMICPNALLRRNDKICDLCINGNIFNSVRYKCVQNSYGASLINCLSTQFHHRKGYFDLIKYFIIPSKFTISKMIEAGFSADKLIHIPTFVSNTKNFVKKKKRKLLYFGRIDKSKGIHILLEAIKYLQENFVNNFQSLIVGSGSDEYINELKTFIQKYDLKNVRFIGFIDKIQLNKLISDSLFSITPSICYDNMPNSVLESLAFGTPVIASNHGSFPEIILHGKTGFLFEPENSFDLSMQMKELLRNEKLCSTMGQNAIEFVKKYHSSENYYIKILRLYETINDGKANNT